MAIQLWDFHIEIGGEAVVELKVLGQRIRQARERLGLSQEELAALVAKDQTAISEYEHGKRKFPVTELPLFAQALQVPLFYFYDSDELAPDDFDRALLAEFHQLPDTSKQSAIEIMRLLVTLTTK